MNVYAIAFLALGHFFGVQAQGGSKGRPSKYVCPKDRGSEYTTPEPNVVTFRLLCDQGTTANRIDDTPKDSQKECADHCAAEPRCQSADYNWSTKNCARFSEYIPTIPMTGVNTWYPLEERKGSGTGNGAGPRPDPFPERTNQCPAPRNVITETVADTAVFTSGSNCPEDDGKIYITADGTYMKISCLSHIKDGKEFHRSPVSSLKECLDMCADTPNCKSSVWEGGRITWDCFLYTDGPDMVIKCPGKTCDTGAIIDPPTIQAADDPIVLCSTECPLADGQTWDSPSGERFRMDCCKRHGVTPIGQEPMVSFKACMAACGQMPSCQSADFHESTGTCYFGKHSGAPTISVAGWASAYSLGCAGACKDSGAKQCCTSQSNAEL